MVLWCSSEYRVEYLGLGDCKVVVVDSSGVVSWAVGCAFILKLFL